jgi:hypothetical protein
MKICPKCNNEHNKSGTFCSRTCANSRCFSNEAKLKKSTATKNAHAAGAYKDSQQYDRSYIYTPEYRERQSNILKDVFKQRPELTEHLRMVNTNKIVSEATRQKLRINAIKNNFGGHTSKTKLYYTRKDGSIVFLQSSYEVTLAESLDINNINWIRPQPFKWVSDSGSEHKYYPDFYLVDYDLYLDTKNDYLIIKDQKKIMSVIQQNNIKLFIIDKHNLTWDSVKNMLE